MDVNTQALDPLRSNLNNGFWSWFLKSIRDIHGQRRLINHCLICHSRFIIRTLNPHVDIVCHEVGINNQRPDTISNSQEVKKSDSVPGFGYSLKGLNQDARKNIANYIMHAQVSDTKNIFGDHAGPLIYKDYINSVRCTFNSIATSAAILNTECLLWSLIEHSKWRKTQYTVS